MSIAVQFLESIEAGSGISRPVHFTQQGQVRHRIEIACDHAYIRSVDSIVFSGYTVTVRNASARRGIVINFLKFDNRDLSMMVGLASIGGAASGEISKALFGTPPANAASLVIVLAAFVAGRYLSGWLRLKRND